MAEARELIRKARGILVSMLLAGVLIIVVVAWKVKDQDLHDIFLHLGVALTIAGIIGLVLEVTEFASYFEERLATVLVQDRFLDVFKQPKLLQIGVAALKKTIDEKVTNPANKWEDFFDVFRAELFPLLTKCYRSHYQEVIDLSFIRATDLGAECKPEEECEVAYTKGIATYELVSPTVDEECEYEIKWITILRRVPGLPGEKHYKCRLAVDGETKPLEGKIQVLESEHDVRIELRYALVFRGSARVELELDEYERAETAGIIAMRMADLTHQVNVTFSSGVQLKLDSALYLMGVREVHPHTTRNAISFTYPGWMLPGHGYSIDWKRP